MGGLVQEDLQEGAADRGWGDGDISARVGTRMARMIDHRGGYQDEMSDRASVVAGQGGDRVTAFAASHMVRCWRHLRGGTHVRHHRGGVAVRPVVGVEILGKRRDAVTGRLSGCDLHHEQVVAEESAQQEQG